MAQKRAFDISVVGKDKFYDLPLSAQALYFNLGMRTDDEGFCDSVKAVQRAY